MLPPQITDFLEANEVSRPVTIRTNTLKTRRRDLAQVSDTGNKSVKVPRWTRIDMFFLIDFILARAVFKGPTLQNFVSHVSVASVLYLCRD